MGRTAVRPYCMDYDWEMSVRNRLLVALHNATHRSPKLASLQECHGCN